MNTAEYKTKWLELHDEIEKVLEMYITKEGKLNGLTGFVMRKIYEAEAKGWEEREWLELFDGDGNIVDEKPD